MNPQSQNNTKVIKTKRSIMTWLSLITVLAGIVFFLYVMGVVGSIGPIVLIAHFLLPFVYGVFILSFAFGLIGILRKEPKRVISISIVVVIGLVFIYTQVRSSTYLNTRSAMNDAQETKTLDLRNIKLEQVPLSIFETDNLRSIDLSDNNISELPSEIGNLKTLERLNLSMNPIKRLPEEIGELDSLVTLLLDFNRLEDMPTQIIKLKNLRFVSIRGTFDSDVLGPTKFYEFAAILPNLTLVTDGFLPKDLISYSLDKTYLRDSVNPAQIRVIQLDTGQYFVEAEGKTPNSYGGNFISFKGNLDTSHRITYKRSFENWTCDLYFEFDLEKVHISGSDFNSCLDYNSAFYGDYKIEL